jgi:hypothetical protein
VLRGAVGLGPESDKVFDDIHAELNPATSPVASDPEPADAVQADHDQPDLPFGEPPAPHGEAEPTIQPVKAAS